MHEVSRDIVACAKGYVGVRWRHQGRDKATGVDCAGLLVCIVNDLGISGFDILGYSRRPNSTEFDKGMRLAGCVKLPRLEIRSGDVVRMAESGWPVHTALYEVDDVGGEWLIHAWAPAHKVVREPLTKVRDAQIRSVWRLPETRT